MRPSLFGFGLTFIVALTGLSIGQAGAATLFLATDDGSGSVALSPGESVDVSILLEIRAIDAGFAYATVFLNDNDDQVAGPLSVTDLADGFVGPDIDYDRTAFANPASTLPSTWSRTKALNLSSVVMSFLRMSRRMSRMCPHRRATLAKNSR